MNSKKSRLHKIAATATAFCVAFTQVAIAAPAFSVSTHEVSLPDTLRLDQAIQISVPSAVATIDKLIPGNSKTIFHIQTAHGQYQAEKQIETLLTHLEQNYGVETLLMEGASQPLDPEVINFFPEDRKSTLEAVDAFVRHSVVSGPEVFLLKSGKARGLGIEDEAAYEQNLQDFAAVISARDSSSKFLSDLEQGIERLAALYLSSDARSFLKQVERKETGDVPFDIYLQQLKLAAEKHAGINLTDASWQLLWPMLTRVFTIEKLEKKIDAAAFKKQKEDFLKAVQSSLSREIYSEVEKLLNLKDLSAKLPDPETSGLFEMLVQSLPDNFNYDRFSSVTAFCGLLMLKSQLQVETLSDEISRMENKIADKLAETKNAKSLISVLKDYRLLKKLFALELLPTDFDSLSSLSIRPSQIVEKLKQINGNARAKEITFTNASELNFLYDKAVRFYEGARLRDAKMLERIEEQLDATGADKVAVVTGGFHSGPFAKYFEERGYSYALMTPKLSTIDAQGRQNYLNVMQAWASAPKDATASNGAEIAASTIHPRPAKPSILIRLASRVLNSDLFQRFQGRYMPRFATGAVIAGGIISPLNAAAQAPAAPTAPAPIVAPAKVPLPILDQVQKNQQKQFIDALKARPTSTKAEVKAEFAAKQVEKVQTTSLEVIGNSYQDIIILIAAKLDLSVDTALVNRLAELFKRYSIDPKQSNAMMSLFLNIFKDSREEVAFRAAAGAALHEGVSNFDFPSNVDSALVRSLSVVFSSSKEDVSVRALAAQILAFLVGDKNLTPLSASDLKMIIDAIKAQVNEKDPIMLGVIKDILSVLQRGAGAGLSNADKSWIVTETQRLNEKLARIQVADIERIVSDMKGASFIGRRNADKIKQYIIANAPLSEAARKRAVEINSAALLSISVASEKLDNPPYWSRAVYIENLGLLGGDDSVKALTSFMSGQLANIPMPALGTNMTLGKYAEIKITAIKARSEARTVDLGGFPDRVSEASINAWANSIAKLAGSDAWIVSFDFVPKAGQTVIQGVAGVNNFASQVLAAAKAAGVIGDESSFEDLGRLLKANYQSMNFVASATTDARSESRLTPRQEEFLAKVATAYTGVKAYIVKYVRMAMLSIAQAGDPNFIEVDSKYVADQNHTGEGFSQTEFGSIEKNQELIDIAKAAHVTVMSLDGGLGEKLRRQDWKKWLIKMGLLDPKSVKMDDKGQPGLGAKGTDMGYLVQLPNGKPYYLSVSESKLINLYRQGQQQRFEGLGFQAIVNGDSIKSYEALFAKPSLIDVMAGVQNPRTYKELLEEVNVSIEDFFFQEKVPSLHYEKKNPADEKEKGTPVPSTQADYDKDGKMKEAHSQEAGHGQVGVATVINPEDYKPREDGKPDFFAFTNGDGQVSSNISAEIIGDMIKNNRAIGNLVTPATRVDRKGGKYIVKLLNYFGVTKWLPGQRELAAAKEFKDPQHPKHDPEAEQKFYDAGQPVGESRFGKGSAGKQPFNTNTFYGNRARLMPFLAELKSVMGEDAYLAQVISPNFMKKIGKKGKDGLDYYPIDSAIGNVYHAINEFVLRMTMVAKAAEEGKIQLSDVQRELLAVIQKHQMAEVIHYYNVPRTFFTPQKNPLDAVIQMVGGFFRFNLETGTLDQTSPSLIPAEFDIKDSKGNAQDSGEGYYSEFLNMLNTFVDTTSIETIQSTQFNVTKLDELKIQGNLSIKETVFIGDVELINESKADDVFDLRAAILASDILKAAVGYQDNAPLTLENIRIVISEDGSVTTSLPSLSVRSEARDWDVVAYLESREVEENPVAVNLAAVQVEEKREVRNPVSVFELSMVKSNGRVVIDEPDDDKPQLPFWAQTDAGQLLWRTVLPGAPPQMRLEIGKRFGAFVQGEISDDGYQLQILARPAAVSDELDVMGLVAVAPSGELFPLVRFAASDIPLLQSQGVVAVENLSLKARMPEQGRLVIEPVVGRSEQRTIEEPIVFQQVRRLSVQKLPKKLVPAAGYNFFRVQLNGDNPILLQSLLASLISAIQVEQSVVLPKSNRFERLKDVWDELVDIKARISNVGEDKSLILAFDPQDRLVTIVTEGFNVNNSDVFVFNHPDAIPSTQILPKTTRYKNLPARTALLAAYNEQGAVLTVQPSAFELARIRLLALLDRFISPEAVVAAYKQQAEDKVNYLGLVEVIEAVLGDEKLNLPTQIQVVGDASEAKVPDTEVASLLTGLRTELAELSQRSEARAVITSADYGQSFTAAFLRAFPERYESPAFQSGAFQDLELTQFEVKVESKAGNFSFVISENESFESIEARVQALADDKTLAVFGKTNGDLFRERHGFAETGQIVFSQSSKITAISIAPYFDRQPATPRSEARLTPEEIATIKVLLSEFTLGVLTTEQIDQIKTLKPTAEQIEQIYEEVFGVSLAEEVGGEVKTAVENFFSEEFLNQLAFSEAARQLPLQTAKSSAEFGWDVYTAAGIDQYSNDNALALVADIEASLQQIGDTRPAKVVYVENDSEKSAVIDLLLAKLNSKDVLPAQRKINKVDLLKAVKFVTAGDEWAAFVKANPSAVAWMNIANENAGMLGGNVFVFNFDRKEFSALTKQKYMAVGFLGLVLRRAMANTRGLDFAQAADLLKQALDQQQANVQRRPDGTFMVASVAQLLQAIVTAKHIEIMA